ncbi:hypothetical protein QQX09_10440 [Demequina sp. SYSU T00192]|uniref:DNA-3-methyladenine glycosylase 2 family protein n=1 Tax=Demequina litoralis TaxID=3051660 RepID=A0ABT8GAV7_9MICO|nr:hypothetical protein [Demequina sp. SYSU T00192]MDN4476273.1 hypothetical protein [Demequina sp. SYSU T00192]
MVEDLVPNLRAALGGILPAGWRDAAPWGYPAQSELALITGVFASQLPEQAVADIADTVMRRRPGSSLDNLVELAAIDAVDLRGIIGDRWGDSTVLGVPRRRADVIHEAARLLTHSGVRTAFDMQDAIRTRTDEVSRLLLSIRGLGPGTWACIAFMVHAPIPPNDDVVALVKESLAGGPPAEDPLERAETIEALDRSAVGDLIRRTAHRLGSDERVLSYGLHRVADERARQASVFIAK